MVAWNLSLAFAFIEGDDCKKERTKYCGVIVHYLLYYILHLHTHAYVFVILFLPPENNITAPFCSPIEVQIVFKNIIYLCF